MDEIDQILNESVAPSAPQSAPQASPMGQQQAARSAAPSMQDIDSILGEMPAIDELTGEEIPEAFAGRSPETAMNKSPLTALDRFKMSMGNDKGNIEYLQKRFDAVQHIVDKKGKPTDELAVMQNGKWHRVDPVNSEIKDPWELAKEYGRDAADLGPLGIGLAAGAAVAATVAAPLAAGVALAGGAMTTGTAATIAAGTGAAAGLATASARTSLGRVVGTYDATPEEQAFDIGFETLLNAAGNTIPLGMKPTATFVAGKLDDLAAAFPKTANAVGAVGDALNTAAGVPKAMFKKLFSALSVGEDNFDTMIENPFKTKSLMTAVDQQTGGNVSAYHDEIARRQITDIKDIAQNARGTLTQIYGKMKDSILNEVPETFTANFDDAIGSTYQNAINKGIGKIVTDEGKALVGVDAAEYMAKNGLKGAKFQLLTQKEMANAVKAGADLGDELAYLGSDKAVYDVVKSYYDDMGRFAGSATRSGRKAAEQLMTFKKMASDKAMALTNMEKVRDVPAIRSLMNQSRVAMDNTIHNGLKAAGVGGKFVEMNAKYSNLSEKFAPLLNANYRYQNSGDPKVYEGLLSQFLTRPGKQVTNRFAVDEAINAAEEHGLGSLAKSLSNSKLKIQVGEAAKAFNPLPSESKKRMAQIGYTGIVGSLASGNPLVAGAIGGGMVARSPMFAQTGVALTQAAFKGQQMLAKLTPDIRKQFLDNPKAVQAFTQAIIQAPQVRNQVSNNLNQVMPSQ